MLFGLAAPVAAQTSATVSVSAPTNANEGNSGTKFKYFTVKLSRAVSQNVTAKICYSGTATRGASADYQLAVFGAVHNSNCWNTIINGGQTSSTIIGIRIRGDTDPESDETVVATLSLTNPPPGVTLGTSTATYTILNDDEDTRPVATITRRSATVTEGTWARFWLSVTPAPDAGLKVNTTRTQSGDFFRSSSLRNHPISYVVGLRRGEFYPPSLDDSVDEPDGSVTVTLASGTGYKVGSPSTATIAVRDNDPTVVSLARVGSGAVTEGDKVELTVTLGRALVAGETVDVPLAIGGTSVTTADWSLAKKSGETNTGVTLRDTGTTTPKVRFEGAGAQTAVLELTATADRTTESTETFTIALGGDSAFDAAALGTNVGGGADPHGTSNAFDVAVSDRPVATITRQSATVTEGTKARFWLSVTPAPDAGLKVNTTRTQSGDFFRSSSLRNHPISYVVGLRRGEFYPPSLDDSVDEPDGSVTVTLTSGTGYKVGSPSTATIAVKDNDPTIVSLARVGSGAVTEGDKVEFTVTLGRALVAGETIDVPLAIGGTNVTTGDWSLAKKSSATNTGVTLRDAGTTTPKVRFEGAGAQTATLELTATADGTAESAETFEIALGANSAFDAAALGTNVGGGADPHGTNNAIDVSVSDYSGPVATITRRSATVTEGTWARFWLSVTPAPDAGLKVNTTRTQSGDFFRSSSLRNHPISYVVGLRRGEFYPPSLDDSVDEPDGSVTVTLTSGTGYKVGSPSTATIAVKDNDPTIVSLARVGSGAVTEGDKVEFTVTLGRALVAGETIDVPLAIGGTNVTTGDWSLAKKSSATNTGVTLRDTATSTPNVRFSGASAQTATLELTATADGTAESAETFEIALGANSAFDASSLGTNVGGGADPHGTNNAFDVSVSDYSGPVATITRDSATVTEGTRAIFTARTTPAASAILTLQATVTQSGDVVKGSPLGDQGLFYFPHQGYGQIGPHTDNDAVDEPDGSVTVTLTDGTGYAVGSPSSATITVRDDDPTVVSLVRTSASVIVNEGGAVGFRVTLARALVAGETIDVPLAIGGTDVTPDDWSLGVQSGQTNTGITLLDAGTTTPKVRFEGAGAQTAVLELTATADRATESTETFTIALGTDSAFDASSLGTNVGGGADPHGALRNFDLTVTDVAPPPAVTVTGGAATVTEGTRLQFTLSATPVPSADLDVNTTQTQRGDFFNHRALGQKKRTILAALGTGTLSQGPPSVDDTVDEPDGSITVTVTSGTGYVVGSPSSATVTVRDDDPTIVRLTGVDGATVSEGATVDLNVTLGRALVAGETIDVPLAIGGTNVTTGDWSLSKKSGATNTGVTLRDTATSTPKVRFEGAGAQTATLELTATADATAESADETFTIALGTDSAFDAAALGTNVGGGADPHSTDNRLEVTVTDKTIVSFSKTNYPVQEGKSVRVELKLSDARTSAVTIRVSATPLTAMGNGVDYSGQTFLATIAAGRTTGAFEIRTTADNFLEAADGEEFRIDIHDFDFPADLTKGTPDTALVTIFDGPRLSFTRPDTTTVFEGGRPLEFTLNARAPYFSDDQSHGFAHVRLSGRASRYSDYRVEYWYPDLGWLKVSRYIAVRGNHAVARMRITALDDGRKESNETATLTLIDLPQVYRDADQPYYTVGTPRTVSFTVADRETVAPRLTSVAHHDPATSTAVSPARLTWRVAFNEDVHDVDASDFALKGTSATLAVERVSGSTFDVTAQGGNLARITGGQVTLSLAPDNDITDGSGNAFVRYNEFTSTYWVHDGTRPTPPVPAVTAEAEFPGVAVTEGEWVSFLFPTNPGPTKNLIVDATLTQSGEVLIAGTRSGFGFVILPAQGSGAGTVQTEDDAVDEPDGSVTATVDSGTGYTVGSPSSATIVVRDNDPTVVSLARTGTGAVTEGGTVELDVTLGRALVAGETIDVPLAIGGTNVTTGDWSLGKKSDATNTGVALLDAGTTTPKVRFEGAGAQTATLELTATSDGTAEGSETFTIALGSDSTFDDAALGTNVGGGADPHGTDNTFDVTVNDGAAPPPGTPAVGFASATSSAAEDAGTHNVTLDLAPAAPSGGLDIAYAVTGTATAGSGNDFTIQGSGTLSVAAGATTATIPVAINDDSVDDDAETVVLTLSSGTGYTLGGTVRPYADHHRQRRPHHAGGLRVGGPVERRPGLCGREPAELAGPRSALAPGARRLRGEQQLQQQPDDRCRGAGAGGSRPSALGAGGDRARMPRGHDAAELSPKSRCKARAPSPRAAMRCSPSARAQVPRRPSR